MESGTWEKNEREGGVQHAGFITQSAGDGESDGSRAERAGSYRRLERPLSTLLVPSVKQNCMCELHMNNRRVPLSLKPFSSCLHP